MRVKQAILLVLGLYVCLVATVSHRHTDALQGVTIPWGLAIGLIAAYAIARVAENWVRLGGAFFGLGWALGLTIPMIMPGESYLIASDWLGLLFMLGGLGALALAVLRGSRPT